MPQLMPHHRGEFGLGIEIGHDAAGDVNVAPRQSEGVHLRAVNHRELVVEIRPVAGTSQSLANAIHIGLQGRCVIFAVLLTHLLIRLAAGVDFVLLGHEDEILLAADGIFGAAERQEGQQRSQQEEGSLDQHGQILFRMRETKKAAKAAFSQFSE
jgi:hypothetical protein